MGKLTESIDTSTPDMYFDEAFRTVIEHHLSYLRNNRNNAYIDLTPRDTVVWKGNFYGLLYEKRIPVEQHWIIMRLNGLDSTMDFKGDFDRIYLPDPERLNKIRDMYNTIN